MEIKITNMELIRNGTLTAKGNKRLATFDAEMLGFVFAGCCLLHLVSGNVIATLPEARGDRDVRRPVWIKNREIGLAFSAAARKAYAQMQDENSDAGLRRYMCPAVEESLTMAGV